MRPRKPAEYPVYQVKVTLRRSRPPIWRRFLVNSDIALDRLHAMLQDLMGWQDCHLHQFIIQKQYYGPPNDDLDMLDEGSVRLRQVAPRARSRFNYEYDFGDGWDHEILVEKVLPPETRIQHPVCLAGKGACPPEDCGGMGGYCNLLNAIQDPAHPQHKELLGWLGGKFDPEAFHLDRINALLKGFR